MKRNLIIAVIFLAIGLTAGWLIFRSGGTASVKSERKILYYRDPMNPSITSPTPKKSSDGMDFVPVYEEGSGAAGGKKIAYYKDPMHPWYTSDKPGIAPDCGMELVPVYEGEGDAKGIKIDPVTVQNIGVKTETAEKRKLTRKIRTTGMVDYDETKVYTVNTKIMGWVETLYVDYTGQYVSKGQPLMEIYSPELVSTQEEYLQAIRYYKKMQGSTSPEAVKGAEDLIQSAKRRLQYWDITDKEIKALEERGAPKKTMTIYSPVNGIVIEKMVLKGQNIMAGMELYKIADLSTVWVQAEVYQYELPWIKLGESADLELSYLPGKTYKGRITYIYPYLGMESKTVKVRIEVKNTPSLEFKQGMFANVNISSPISVESVAVPDQAIIHTGKRDVAIISLGNGYFEPRDVKLGVTADGYVQILDGIHEGEQIVTSSQFLIDSESNLKAALNAMVQPTTAGKSSSTGDSKSAQEKSSGDQNQQMNMPMPQKNDHEKMNMKDDKQNMSGDMKMGKDEKMPEAGKEKHSSPVEYKGAIDVKSIDDNKDGKIYQCPMDFNVLSDKPGVDPKCGMKLQEVTIKQANENLVKHGFRVSVPSGKVK